MTTSSAANPAIPVVRRARSAAGWLGLAASPTFALMAWIAAGQASPICAAGSSLFPIDGMAAMYLLMSLFHLSPWLSLASGHVRART